MMSIWLSFTDCTYLLLYLYSADEGAIWHTVTNESIFRNNNEFDKLQDIVGLMVSYLRILTYKNSLLYHYYTNSISSNDCNFYFSFNILNKTIGNHVLNNK